MEVPTAPTCEAYHLMNLPTLKMDSKDCLKVIQELQLVSVVKSGGITIIHRGSGTSCARSQTITVISIIKAF